MYVGHRYPEALAEEEQIARRWPEHLVPLLYAQILIQLHREKEAGPWLARSDPTSKIRLAVEGILSARAGDVGGALAKKAELQRLYGDGGDYPCAQIDAQLGRKDEAFAELNRAWAMREPGLGELWWQPWFDPIRSDARFADLLRKIQSSELNPA